MKILAFAICLATAPLVFPQVAASAKSANLSRGDASFLKKADEGGIAEVKLGQLAQKNGGSERVKQFGEQMVKDHTKMGDEVKTLASQENIQLPGDMDGKDKANYDRLAAKTGSDFDKEYISLMIRDHQKDIAEFQKEVNNGNEEDVKSLASKALPTLQEHLRMAQDVAPQVGVSK